MDKKEVNALKDKIENMFRHHTNMVDNLRKAGELMFLEKYEPAKKLLNKIESMKRR